MTTASDLRTANLAELDRYGRWLREHAVTTFAVSGSRTWARADVIRVLLSWLPLDAVMLHGAARGFDTTAARLWERQGHRTIAFPVTDKEWRAIGRRAGIVRNEIMLSTPGVDLLLACIRDNSPGSSHAVAYARELEIPTFVFRA